MASETLKALILEADSARPYGEIGRVLAEELGMFPPDAVSRVRYGGGILLGSVEGEVAESIARVLRVLDVETRVIPAETLEGLPRGIRGSRINLLDDAICIGLAGGREVVVLDRDVRALNVHAIPPVTARDEETDDRDAINVPVFSALKEGYITERGLEVLNWISESGEPAPQFVLTLYASDPVGPIRFERDSVDYSVLGEGKLRHSMDNFLGLVELMAARYSAALNLAAVTGFLQSLDPRDILVHKREEAQNVDRWIQAIMRCTDLEDAE